MRERFACTYAAWWPSGVVIPCIATYDKPQTAGFGNTSATVLMHAAYLIMRVYTCTAVYIARMRTIYRLASITTPS